MAKDRWYNPLMRWLLRSPFHSVISKSVLLISFTGRKSGRAYSTPISYRRNGQIIRLISHRGRAWWRNFEGGAPVTVRLEGKDLPATASIVPASGADMISAIRDVYGGMPASRAAQLAEDSVLIQVRLAQTSEAQPQQQAARPA